METHFRSFSGPALFWNLLPYQRIHGLGYIRCDDWADQKSVHESDTSSKQKEGRKSQPRRPTRNLFSWWLLLGRRGIFLPCSRCDRCCIRVRQWEGRYNQVWIGPSNRPCRNSSHHLQCQAGISERIAPALFSDYRPNVEESSRKRSRDSIPNRCLLCLSRRPSNH